MEFTFLDLKKEYAQKRGELQNGSITGMNTDAQNLMEKNLNRTIQELADLHPPFLAQRVKLTFTASTTLDDSSGNYTVTGTTGIPRIIDSNSNLKKRDIYSTVSDGNNFYTIIEVSGTTYTLDNALYEGSTTATAWTVYRNNYPLRHNMGDVNWVYYEDGERPISPTNSLSEFQAISARNNSSSYSPVAGIDVFSPVIFGDYKFRETSVTCTNASRLVTVADSNYYFIGDVLKLSSGTTVNIHTIAGLDETNNQIHLDRAFDGTSGGWTLDCNPIQHTNWISFHPMPSERKSVVMDGWIQPQDMVYDTELCVFPARLCPLIVIGALMKDKLSMEVLTEQWVTYYRETIKLLRKKKKSGWDEVPAPDNWTGVWGDDYDFEDYTYA